MTEEEFGIEIVREGVRLPAKNRTELSLKFSACVLEPTYIISPVRKQYIETKLSGKI